MSDVLHQLLVLVVFAVATGAVNAVFSFKTPEQWEAFVASYPRGAKVVKALRKAGFDLPGLIRMVAPLVRTALAKLAAKYGVKTDDK